MYILLESGNNLLQESSDKFLVEGSAPSVVLDSPSDTGSVTTTTPTLEFTGTDSDGDAISYEVQVDTATTFDSSSTTGQSYGTSYASTGGNLYSGSTIGQGQTITGDGSKITYLQFYLQKSGSPPGNVTASIYAVDGSHLPTGTALASATITASSAFNGGGVAWGLSTFTFSSPFTTTSGTEYALTCEYSSGDSSNDINIAFGSSSLPSGYSLDESSSGIWATTLTGVYSPIFYTGSTAPLIDALSSTDAGFTDTTNGTDTDPFASGDTIDYTVQSGDALTNTDTYYWRVRGKDPSGTNTWGDWSATDSFTVSTNATISATGVSSTLTFGVPTLSGIVTISPSGISSTLSIGTPTVSPGAMTISPTGITSTGSVGVPTVSSGIATIPPSGITSTLTLGSPSVTPGAVTITTTGIVSTLTFGSPALSSAISASITSITSGLSIGAPTVTPGKVSITPTSIASTASFGSPTVAVMLNIAPTGIPSTVSFGTPYLVQILVFTEHVEVQAILDTIIIIDANQDNLIVTAPQDTVVINDVADNITVQGGTSSVITTNGVDSITIQAQEDALVIS